MILFPFDAVCRHIRKKHPGCPDFAVNYIAGEIAGREWQGVKLNRAVGIIMQSLLRHQMTDYEALLLHGVSRKEARKRVQPRIQAMLKVWARCPAGAPVPVDEGRNE